jgi:hypothetical protein
MPALGMDRVMGQPRGGAHVGPRQLPRPPDPGLVVVEHRRPPQRRLDRVLNGPQYLRALLHPPCERAQRDVRAHEIGQQVAHPCVGDELLLDEVDHKRA